MVTASVAVMLRSETGAGVGRRLAEFDGRVVKGAVRIVQLDVARARANRAVEDVHVALREDIIEERVPTWKGALSNLYGVAKSTTSPA